MMPATMGRSQSFRANVGIVVIDARGRVLAFERADRPGAWQLPQGGIDIGEDPLAAAKRELREETGLKADEHTELLAEHPEWLAYELPRRFRRNRRTRGQVQKWFLLRLIADESNIAPAAAVPAGGRAEFRDWRWMALRTLARETIFFRRPIYAKLADAFAVHLADDDA